MKHRLKSFLACGLIAVVAAATLTACGGTASVTIQDGSKVYVITDANGQTVQELLDFMGIVLSENDEVSVPLDSVVTGDAEITILREVTVKVIIDGKEQTITLKGARVKDVLDQLKLTRSDDLVINFSDDEYLSEGMVLNIAKAGKQVAQEEETEETEETQASASSGSRSSSSSGRSSSGGSSSSGSSGNSSSAPAATQPSEPETTTAPARYVVSEEYYDDCDGSGHGVKIITYSDGTQEEIPY